MNHAEVPSGTMPRYLKEPCRSTLKHASGRAGGVADRGAGSTNSGLRPAPACSLLLLASDTWHGGFAGWR